MSREIGGCFLWQDFQIFGVHVSLISLLPVISLSIPAFSNWDNRVKAA